MADWGVMEYLEAGSYVAAIVGFVALAPRGVRRILGRIARFTYPAVGEYGPNILSPETSSVFEGKVVSMSALVPEGADLAVSLSGHFGVSEMGAVGPGAGWYYQSSPSPLNWRARDYMEGDGSFGPTQHFSAKAGQAELRIYFCRPGEVGVAVYERGSHVPTWTKTIHVLAAPSPSAAL